MYMYRWTDFSIRDIYKQPFLISKDHWELKQNNTISLLIFVPFFTFFYYKKTTTNKNLCANLLVSLACCWWRVCTLTDYSIENEKSHKWKRHSISTGRNEKSGISLNYPFLLDNLHFNGSSHLSNRKMWLNWKVPGPYGRNNRTDGIVHYRFKTCKEFILRRTNTLY